jgi:ABC-type glutathione transport system ATPase component
MLSVRLKYLSQIKVNSEKELLHDINFELEQNKINVILGKNGTGKSTFIKALTRLLDDRFYNYSGSVVFNNKDLLSIPNAELLLIRQKQIKYVFQDATNSFDQLRRLEYYFKKYDKNKLLISLLDYFMLPEKNKLFKLYPYEISGGMAQRVLLVIALLADPEILILDEPTSGIDSPVLNLILLKLKGFVKENGKSVLLVTQDLHFARAAGDRLAYLSGGTLSSFSMAEEFFNPKNSSSTANFIEAYNQLQ